MKEEKKTVFQYFARIDDASFEDACILAVTTEQQPKIGHYKEKLFFPLCRWTFCHVNAGHKQKRTDGENKMVSCVLFTSLSLSLFRIEKNDFKIISAQNWSIIKLIEWPYNLPYFSCCVQNYIYATIEKCLAGTFIM